MGKPENQSGDHNGRTSTSCSVATRPRKPALKETSKLQFLIRPTPNSAKMISLASAGTLF